MKKYKLIKEYPGSPKLGTIVVDTNINNGAKDSYFSENWGKPNRIKAFIIGKQHDCENNPEFWEEVVEAEYEILSFKMYGVKIAIKNNKGLFQYFYNCPEFTEEYLLNTKDVAIHSVKRLSDGEIFTIGDTINNKYIIDRFIIDYDRMSVYLDEKTSLGRWVSFKDIFHSKPFVFTTEDGLYIRKGDPYWYILIDSPTTKHDINWYPSKAVADWRNPPLPPLGKKQFSTLEAAREYILMNKPCLSIREAAILFLNTTETYTSSVKRLKEYIKKNKL